MAIAVITPTAAGGNTIDITADIRAALAVIGSKADGCRLYSQYYEGDHRLAFATEEFRSTFGVTFRAFADNLCSSIVDALSDRLQLTGFGQEQEIGKVSDSDPDAALDNAKPQLSQDAIDAWDIWQDNRMDQRANEAHVEAFITGDSYVIVWPDPITQQPVIYPNESATMATWYDEETPGRIVRAAKLWALEDGRVRLNMYYPDAIRKFIAGDGKAQGSVGLRAAHTYEALDFVPYVPIGGSPDDSVVLNPYGQVPVFHLANNGRMNRPGVSELRNVVPLQDALNKCLADMLVAMEFIALPQRVIMGIETEIDPVTGKPKIEQFRAGAERLWIFANSETKLAQFDQADITHFITVAENFRAEIARVSHTPAHYFMLSPSAWPSGEAMKTAEAPFTGKAYDRQLAFGDVWEDVLAFALRIQRNIVLGVGFDVSLGSVWKDPVSRSDLEQAQEGALALAAGVPEDVVWVKYYGFTPAQAYSMKLQRAQVQAQAQAQAQLQLQAQQVQAQLPPGGAAPPAVKPPFANGSKNGTTAGVTPQ